VTRNPSSIILQNKVQNEQGSHPFAGGEFRRICDGVDPPPKPFDGAKRLFPGKKLRRCGEGAGDAVEELKRAGVLIEEMSGA